MDYNKRIIDMKTGDAVEGFYVLKAAAIKTASNGGKFLAATLMDNSGTIDLKHWDYNGSVSGDDAGKVVKVRGSISEYKGAAQMTASNIRLAQNNEYDASALVPIAPIDVEESMKNVELLLSSIADEDYKKISMAMFEKHKNSFRSIPAAKKMHHGFLSGLLMHTSNMLQVADGLSYIYRNVIDRSLLLAGTFLHDIAKEQEFTVSELGLVNDYSAEGMLLGHLVMGAQEIARVGDKLGVPKQKSVLLQHLLLSHHGEPDWGAAVRPMCAEAELLHYIDLIDSRMELYAETLPTMNAGEFSANRVPGLDKKVFRHS